MRRTLLLAFSLLCLAVHPAWSQTRPKLNVVYPAISGINAALWAAAEANSFQKYGLDVTLVYIPSAPQVVRVMLAGDSQISLTGGAPVGNPNLRGADLVFIGGGGNVPALFFFAFSGLKNISEVKGKKSA